MRKNHLYKINKLVIGTDLSALIYAYLNNCTLVFKEVVAPTAFEFLPLDFPLHLFNHKQNITQMKTYDGTIHFGTPKMELWNKLLFTMSSAGHLPFGIKDVSIRQKDKSVTIKTKSRNYYYEVSEIQTIKNNYDKIKVYDWIDIRSCGPINFEHIETKDDFIKELFFYPSERVGAQKTMLDIVAVSELSSSDLESFDYGETMSRIKVSSMLKQVGIKGPRNGKNPTYPRSPEKYKYAPIKLEHNRREIRNNKTNNSEMDMVQDFLKKEKASLEDSYLYKFDRIISQERIL